MCARHTLGDHADITCDDNGHIPMAYKSSLVMSSESPVMSPLPCAVTLHSNQVTRHGTYMCSTAARTVYVVVRTYTYTFDGANGDISYFNTHKHL